MQGVVVDSTPIRSTPLRDNMMLTDSPFAADRSQIHTMVSAAFAKRASNKPPITPKAGRLQLVMIQPTRDARSLAASETAGPSRFPGEPPLFVGSSDHASDVKLLKRLEIGAVLNCAPSACNDPTEEYQRQSIAYLELDARDDREFQLLRECLAKAREFIEGSHADGRGVLVHCTNGVNRSATLAIAHLLIRDRRCLFDLFRDCVRARPTIVKNESFQHQLCALASRNALLYESDYARTLAADGSKETGATEPSSREEPQAEAPMGAGPDGKQGSLKAHKLTGNREMAEDLERVTCPTCSRLFAPSVLGRHAPICAARAAKDAERSAKVAQKEELHPSSAQEVAKWLEDAGLLLVPGLLEAIVRVAPNLGTLSAIDRDRLDAAIAPVQLKPKSQKYKNLMAAHEELQRRA